MFIKLISLLIRVLVQLLLSCGLSALLQHANEGTEALVPQSPCRILAHRQILHKTATLYLFRSEIHCGVEAQKLFPFMTFVCMKCKFMNKHAHQFLCLCIHIGSFCSLALSFHYYKMPLLFSGYLKNLDDYRSIMQRL